MNNTKLQDKVNAAMDKYIQDKGTIAPVEVLIEIGALSKVDYENWRFGRVPYLERVCKMNLSKLTTVNRFIRAYSQKYNLKSSWTCYKKWGKGTKVILHFSKSGDKNIERFYATHYISQEKSAKAKLNRVSAIRCNPDVDIRNNW